MIKKKRIKVLSLILVILILPVSALAFDMISLTENNRGQTVFVIQKRLQDLHFFAFKNTGTYGSMTRNAIITFQEINGLPGDGVVGEETFDLLFSNDASRNPIAATIPIGPTSSGEPDEFGNATPWEDVDDLLQLNTTFRLTDLNTGETFNIIRTGGVNHAKVAPATSSDHEKFQQIFGGEYNWSKRPVMVQIGGQQIAASLQGMPNGLNGVSGNGMDGSCNLYFRNSLSDVSNLPDTEHRRVILRAAGSW